MKRTVFTAAALLTLTLGTVTATKAVEFEVGPGGVRVERGYERGYHDRYYRDRDRGDCRTIITHRTNRYGEDVTVRRQVCD
jgi:hypothetical protein